MLLHQNFIFVCMQRTDMFVIPGTAVRPIKRVHMAKIILSRQRLI